VLTVVTRWTLSAGQTKVCRGSADSSTPLAYDVGEALANAINVRWFIRGGGEIGGWSDVVTPCASLETFRSLVQQLSAHGQDISASSFDLGEVFGWVSARSVSAAGVISDPLYADIATADACSLLAIVRAMQILALEPRGFGSGVGPGRTSLIRTAYGRQLSGAASQAAVETAVEASIAASDPNNVSDLSFSGLAELDPPRACYYQWFSTSGTTSFFGRAARAEVTAYWVHAHPLLAAIDEVIAWRPDAEHHNEAQAGTVAVETEVRTLDIASKVTQAGAPSGSWGWLSRAFGTWSFLWPASAMNTIPGAYARRGHPAYFYTFALPDDATPTSAGQFAYSSPVTASAP
jgi:hypothetical protein